MLGGVRRKEEGRRKRREVKKFLVRGRRRKKRVGVGQREGREKRAVPWPQPLPVPISAPPTILPFPLHAYAPFCYTRCHHLYSALIYTHLIPPAAARAWHCTLFIVLITILARGGHLPPPGSAPLISPAGLQHTALASQPHACHAYVSCHVCRTKHIPPLRSSCYSAPVAPCLIAASVFSCILLSFSYLLQPSVPLVPTFLSSNSSAVCILSVLTNTYKPSWPRTFLVYCEQPLFFSLFFLLCV